MTAQTVFGQPASPASLVADTAGYTLGMQFALTSNAPLTGIWFFSASGAGALPGACCIFSNQSQAGVAGTVNTSPTWSGAAGSGWVKCSYNGSVTLTSATHYRVAVFYAGGSNWYSDTAAYFVSGAGSGGLTSGIITVPNEATADDSGVQDGFNTNTSGMTYPASGTSGPNYWIDVEVTAPTVVQYVYQMRTFP